MRFLKRVKKIKVVIIVLVLVTLILKHRLLDLTWGQFISKKYRFDKNNLYIKNIFWLISSLPRIKLILSIITIVDRIQYLFENKAELEVPEKLVIVETNLLMCYIIVKLSYTRLLVIIKQIFMGIKFEVFRKTSCTYDGLAKLRRETRLS